MGADRGSAPKAKARRHAGVACPQSRVVELAMTFLLCPAQLCGGCHQAAAGGAPCGLPPGVPLSALVRETAERIPEAKETVGDIHGPLFESRLVSGRGPGS